MKKYLLLIFLSASFQIANAQYTDIINSKRPGFSESPYGVGTDVLQVEAGIFYGKGESDATFSRLNPMGATIFVRYGKILEKLEINAKASYQKNDLQFKNIFTSTTDISGISQLTIGAKYLVFQQEFTDRSKEIRSWKKRTAFDKKRLIPSVGVYLGYHINNVLGDGYKEEKNSPKAAILLQNDFSDRLNLITNLIADKLGTDYSYYSYIATLTFATSPRWSIFIENQGDFYDYKTDLHLGTGIAFLYSQNLQFDASIRTSGNTLENSFTTGLGVSWRLNRHKDELVEIQKKEKSKVKKKRDNFFSRLFKKRK